MKVLLLTFRTVGQRSAQHGKQVAIDGLDRDAARFRCGNQIAAVDPGRDGAGRGADGAPHSPLPLTLGRNRAGRGALAGP